MKMRNKYFSASPVVCGRGNSYDAEVQFQMESSWMDKGEFKQERSGGQWLVQDGLKTREEALTKAEEVVRRLNDAMESAAKSVLASFKEAKP